MTRTTLRFPLRLLDELYGSEEYDVAGDDLINALYQVQDYPGQIRCDFQFDSSHSNPWYHAMLFSLEGICQVRLELFLEALGDLVKLASVETVSADSHESST